MNDLTKIQTVWRTKIHFNTKMIYPNQKLARNGDILVSCGQSESVVRFIDSLTGHLIQKHKDIEILSSYKDDTISCSVINDGSLFCAYSSGRILKVPIERDGDIRQNNSSNMVGTISDIVVYNGQLLTAGSWQCGLKLWDLDYLQLRREILDRESRLHSILYLSKSILAGIPPNLSKEIILYDIEVEKIVNKLIGHTDMVTSISAKRGSNIIASGSKDKTIKIWDTVSCKCLQTIEAGAIVQEVKYSKDGKVLLASLCQPPIIKIYNSSDYAEPLSYNGHTDNAECWTVYSSLMSDNNCSGFSIGSDGYLHKLSINS